MIIRVAEPVRNGMLEAVVAAIGAGGSPGILDMLSATGTVLAKLRFQHPPAPPPHGGAVEFGLVTGQAIDSGLATAARIMDSEGRPVLVCDVSDHRGDGVIKLHGSAQLTVGMPVTLHTFVLDLPA